MKDNSISQEKKEVKTVKGSYFEVPGVPISDVKGESDTKKAQGSFFEVPGTSKFDFKGESGIKSEEKIEEKNTSGYSASFERKEPKESDFKAPGELETGYTEKSWAKPEKSMEETATVKTEDVLSETVEQTTEIKDREGIEREERERENKEKEAREKENKEREAREKEDKEREEKRTVYTVEKRLTKSKTDRKLFGVCGGLAEYFGIDPTLVRLAFVLLGILHGIGLILYIILAIIMPSEKNIDMSPSYRE